MPPGLPRAAARRSPAHQEPHRHGLAARPDTGPGRGRSRGGGSAAAGLHGHPTGAVAGRRPPALPGAAGVPCAAPPGDPLRVRLLRRARGAARPPSRAPGGDACALRAFRPRRDRPRPHALHRGRGRGPDRARRGAESRRRGCSRARCAASTPTAAVATSGWLALGPYVGDYGRNYLGRAVVARTLLGALTAEENVYLYGFDDSRGRPLSGRHRYRVRFARGQLPPVGAFWSLTMYNRDSYLYANPIDRYAIGDRTPGLRRAPDGSLTLYLQHRPPSGAARANWLPSPRGRFRVIMRLYEPRRSVLEGSWRPPPAKPSLTTPALGTLEQPYLMEPKTLEKLDRVVVRFAGDSGDGMQLTGSRFTDATAVVGNDLATLPDFPAEIRAPAGTPHGVSAFQIHFASRDILTPGDSPNVLVAMNPAALITQVGSLEKGGTVIVNQDGFTDPQPAQGRLLLGPARGRLAGRLPALPGADDLDDRPRHRGDRGDHRPRRGPLQEPLRPRPGLAGCTAAPRGPASTGWRRSSPTSRTCATPTSRPSGRATTSARRPS